MSIKQASTVRVLMRKFASLSVIAVAIYFFLTPSHSHATTFVNRSLGDVTKEASVIVRGKTGDAYSDWGKETGRRAIYTYTSLVVTEVIKGELKDSKILLRQPGGSKDGMNMMVPGSAHFGADEDVVVLLSAFHPEDGSYDVPGLVTGKYTVSTNEKGEAFLENGLGGAALYEPGQGLKDAHQVSYNTKIPLDVFRKVAQGKTIPEAELKQFRDQAPQAPADSTQSSSHQERKTSAASVATAGAAKNAPDENAKQDAIRIPWIPVSFGILVVIAGVIFFRTLRGSTRKDDV